VQKEFVEPEQNYAHSVTNSYFTR